MLPTPDQLLVALTSQGIVTLDRRGQIVSASHRACELLQVEPDKLSGQSYRVLSWETSGPATSGAELELELALANGEFVDAVRLSGDPSRRLKREFKPVERDGEHLGFALLLSALPRAFDAENLLRTVIESSPYAVITTDTSGTITHFNPAAERLLGYQAEELVDRLTPSCFHLPEEVVAVSQELEQKFQRRIEGFEVFATLAREGGVADERPWTYVRRDGKHVPVLLSVTALRSDDGDISAYVGFARDMSELSHAQRAVAERDHLLQAVFEASVDANFVIDASGRILATNPAASRLLGFATSELIGSNISKIMPPDVASEHGGYLHHYEQTRRAKILGIGREVKAQRADGTPVSVELVVTEALLDGERVYAGTLRDISERKAAEEERARLREQLEEAIACLDAGFAMYDADERLVICNAQYQQMYGMQEGLALPGRRYEDLLRQTARGLALRLGIENAETTDTVVAQRLEHFRNPRPMRLIQFGERWFRMDERRTESGNVVSLHTDVTALKRAEFDSRVQEERLRLAASAGELGIWDLDLKTNELVWDEKMLRIHGYTPEDFPGSYDGWRQRVHPQELSELEQHLQECIAQRREFRRTFRIKLPDGSVRHIQARSAFVRDATGEAVRLLGVNLDVTEHFETTARLHAAVAEAQQATRTKAEFLATMSHEIRTPMNAVIGMTDLLVATQLDPEQRELALTIRGSGESLLTLINDILDYSKMEAGKLKLETVPFCLSQLASEVCSLFTDQAERKGVTMRCVLPDDAQLWVVGDPTRVRQVLLNLTSNAVKFTELGEVLLRVGVVQHGTDVLDVALEVKDTGVGMSSEYLSRIGEAFTQADASTTRQFGGTGLGLSICRNLVKLMGGELDVDSTLGQGSRFVVRLRLSRHEPTPRRDSPKASRSAGPRLKRVLVAEDNVVNQRVVGLMLRSLAEVIDIVPTGCEALDRLRDNNYDCILMDGQMPEMDGLEATRRIRELERCSERKRTPIIALTANALPGDRSAFLEAGMDEYLTKPIRRDDLSAVMARVADGEFSTAPVSEPL